MPRTLVSLVTVVIVVCLTASIAIAGMRVNSISFTALSTLDTSTTTLATASTGDTAMAKSETTRTSKQKTKTGQGACAEPCTGLYLHADGSLVGIGTVGETILVIEATGVPVVMCTNQGGNMAPGQNPPKVTTSGQQQIGVTQITKNGAATIDVTTELPAGDIPGSQMGCPNDNWTATITGIQFTDANVTVYQDGALVLQESYVF